MRALIAALAALATLGVGTVAADDWTAERLRGRVLQFVDGEWQPLNRGMIVPDDRVIRTMGGARVRFTRDGEAVELGGNTQIQIHDEARQRSFTTVKQHFGEVEVDVMARDVQHFAVQTPHLVAVVKGTRFTVTSGEDESRVRVRRGAVSVADRSGGSQAMVVAGQSAEAGENAMLHVEGRGVLPVVVDVKGWPIVSPNDSPGTPGQFKQKKVKTSGGEGSAGGKGSSASPGNNGQSGSNAVSSNGGGNSAGGGNASGNANANANGNGNGNGNGNANGRGDG